MTYGMPELEDMQKLRKAFNHQQNVYSIYNSAPLVFYRLFLPCVGSVKQFQRRLHQEKISDIYTVSQEGYVLLELSNNYTVWMTDALRKYKHPDEIVRDERAQYQQKHSSGSVDDGTTVRQSGNTGRGTLWTHSRYYNTMDGWSEEGMQNYNKFCHNIKNDRQEQHGQEFENKLLQQMKADKNIGNYNQSDQSTFVQPYNDLWGDIETNEADNNFNQGEDDPNLDQEAHQEFNEDDDDDDDGDTIVEEEDDGDDHGDCHDVTSNVLAGGSGGDVVVRRQAAV